MVWGIFPRPGIEAVSPALAGGFLSTIPPEKSKRKVFNKLFHSLLFWGIPKNIYYLLLPVNPMEKGFIYTSVKVKSLQLCPTLCDPMGCSPPGSSVHGIFQAGVLEWVAISFSRGSSQPRDHTWVSLIVGQCFTIWAIRETLHKNWIHVIFTS